MTLFRWDVPGYAVAFSTRLGGVSDEPFASLNLGRRSGDDVAKVDENRRRLCAPLGADPERLTINYQTHSARVRRARAGEKGELGDGLWTDEPGVPMLALGADCPTVAIAKTDSDPALAVLHAGWRGLLEGVVASAAAALGGRLAAVVGPAIGPCCYEVGPEVAEPFTARFGADVVRGRILDLWTSAERALHAAGCSQVERIDLCTRCNPELFFSERRTGKPRGGHGVLGYVV
jgi:polyphenol oxidase